VPKFTGHKELYTLDKCFHGHRLFGLNVVSPTYLLHIERSDATVATTSLA